MDIAAALASTQPTSRSRACLFARNLATIPDDNPDKGALLDAVEDAEAFPAPRLAQIMHAIGLPVSMSLIRQHRAGTCPCYLVS